MVSVREVDSVRVGFEDPGTSAQTLIASIEQIRDRKIESFVDLVRRSKYPCRTQVFEFRKKTVIGDDRRDQGLELENLRAKDEKRNGGYSGIRTQSAVIGAESWRIATATRGREECERGRLLIDYRV
ncbi:hypothetical protein F2Q70_00009676 [Brassica cretica]|uniref:Uncharacterized protein n=1 Tax=Brassica cretica TaxID=69181 RepID=A0A8S9LWM0_BRACR|nr:hypothetical protein F2Q70_00009676 [Brassica cretica]